MSDDLERRLDALHDRLDKAAARPTGRRRIPGDGDGDGIAYEGRKPGAGGGQGVSRAETAAGRAYGAQNAKEGAGRVTQLAGLLGGTKGDWSFGDAMRELKTASGLLNASNDAEIKQRISDAEQYGRFESRMKPATSMSRNQRTTMASILRGEIGYDRNGDLIPKAK